MIFFTRLHGIDNIKTDIDQENIDVLIKDSETICDGKCMVYEIMRKENDGQRRS